MGAIERTRGLNARILLEIDEMGVAFIKGSSSRVNITFVSNASTEHESFELQIFPFYRICILLLNSK